MIRKNKHNNRSTLAYLGLNSSFKCQYDSNSSILSMNVFLVKLSLSAGITGCVLGDGGYILFALQAEANDAKHGQDFLK